jgi:hypothetical protein
VLLVVLVLGACDATHHRSLLDHATAPQPALRTYNADDLSFTYPGAWKRQEVGNISGVGGSLYPFVCVSSSSVGDCFEPRRLLGRNDVVVTWSFGWYDTGRRSVPAPDRNGVPSACHGIGAQAGREVDYQGFPVYRVVACWRGSLDQAIPNQVQAALASVKLTFSNQR